MKVAVILTARPSWSKLEPVCRALKARPDVELQIIACASALLERYGKVVEVVKAQGYAIAAEIYSVYEGESLLTSAKETGALLTELAPVLQRLSPELVLVCADRHEVLAAAQAARYQHIKLAHMQGGEISQSIDNSVRNSITALADLHFVATRRALFRVYGLTGSSTIYQVGCPSIDCAQQALSEPPVTKCELGGAGVDLDPEQPFVLVLQHPNTEEVHDAADQMRITLEATRGYQRLVMWSGQDAGAGATAKVIRMEPNIHTLRNLSPSRFLRLLAQCSAIVGNSSASVREAAFIGTPSVVIGTRQFGREMAQNAVSVPHDREKIRAALEAQIQHGRYKSDTLYGNGQAGETIAAVLCGERARTISPQDGGKPRGHARAEPTLES